MQALPVRYFAIGYLLAAIAPCALSQERAAVTDSSGSVNDSSSATAAVRPGDVNLQVSRVYTFVDKTGFGHQHAVEGRIASGKLRIGASESAGLLVFDMTSFTADTEAARRYIGLKGSTDASTRSKVTKNMKSADVLDVVRYPTATFAVDSAVALGKQSAAGLPLYELRGNFTLHGKQHPIRVGVEVEQARGWLHVRGRFPIEQSDYGIKPYSTALGAIGVADRLEIHGDLWIAPTDLVALESIPEHK